MRLGQGVPIFPDVEAKASGAELERRDCQVVTMQTHGWPTTEIASRMMGLLKRQGGSKNNPWALLIFKHEVGVEGKSCGHEALLHEFPGRPSGDNGSPDRFWKIFWN